MTRQYSNTAVATTLTGGISNSVTSCAVVAVTGFPTAPFTVIMDQGTASEELCEVTAVGGTTLTITRGVDGTSAVTHLAGAAVVHGVSARDFQEPQSHIAGTSGIHGISGAFVDTTSVQSLTNKTLTAPTITAPAISSGGTWSGSPTLSTPSITTPVITSGGSWAGSPTLSTPTIADFTNATHTHVSSATGGSIAGYQYSGSTSFSSSQTYTSSGYADVTSATLTFTAPSAYPSGASGLAVHFTIVMETTVGTISGLKLQLVKDGTATGILYDGVSVDGGTGGKPFQYQWLRPLPASGSRTYKIQIDINTSATLRVYSGEYWIHVV